MIPEKIEDTLKGGYAGLVGEVVTEDCYRLRQLEFIPDIILDLGGNIGVFARYARELFPKSLIVSVEPHPENQQVFQKFTNDKKIILIKKAIGTGIIWHDSGAANGSGEVYLSSGVGYPEKEMDKIPGKLDRFNTETIMLSDLIETFINRGKKSLVKIDIEGNEHIIFMHRKSMELLKNIDYICMEVHWYALTGDLIQDVRDMTHRALGSLMETHNCELKGVHFWATKK